MRAKTNRRVCSEKFAEEKFQRSFQVCHADVPINVEPFDLVKLRRVCGIDLVAPIGRARRNHPDRRRRLFHGADLHRRSVCSKQSPIRKVESVLFVARRMIRRRVQRVEAMIFVFNFRPVSDDETDLAKTPDNILGHLGEGMQFAQRAAASWQGKISWLLRQRRFEFQFHASLGQGGFQFGFDDVNQFARCGFFLFGQGAELFQQRGESSLRSEKGSLGLIQRGQEHLVAVSGAQYVQLRQLAAQPGAACRGGAVLDPSALAKIPVSPAIVFINCCHLGVGPINVEGRPEFAANVAIELVKLGARCMIAAGWAIDDDVAAELEHLRRSRDASLKDLVNDALRLGLQEMKSPPKKRKQKPPR